MIIFIMILVALSAAVWSSLRLRQGYTLTKAQKWGLFAFFLFLWLLPIIYRKLGFENVLVYTFPYHVLGFLFFWGYLFFIFALIQDAIWGLRWLWKQIKSNPEPFPWKEAKRIRRANIWCLIFSLVLSLFALYAGLKTPEVREVKIYTSKLDSNFTIVALGDLHMHHNLSLNKIQKLVDKVNALQPDVIVFLGDFADEGTNELHQQLFELSQLEARLGKFAVAGNHDFYLGHEEAKEAFKEAEFTYLFNEGVQVTDQLYLAGIPDYRTVRQISDAADVVRALSSARQSDYRILLSHRPNFIDQLTPRQIDLQLSAHTHGGQFFPHHFIVKLMNKYLSGFYQTKKGKLYVSSGAGQWGAQMRLFAPSEITVIRLIAEAQNVQPINKGGNKVSVKTAETPQTPDKKEIYDSEESRSQVAGQVKDKSKKSLLKPIAGTRVKKPVQQKAVQRREDQELPLKEEQKELEKIPQTSADSSKETLKSRKDRIERPQAGKLEIHQQIQAENKEKEETQEPFEDISKDIDSLIASIRSQKADNKTNESEETVIETSANNISAPLLFNADDQDTNNRERLNTNTAASSYAGEEESPVYKEELYIEVLRKNGQISSVRIYNANHDLIADTLLREGTSVLTHTLHNTDGSVETHETIMHVRTMPERHITKETTQVFEKKRPQIESVQPTVEEIIKPAFSPAEDSLPSSVDNQ